MAILEMKFARNFKIALKNRKKTGWKKMDGQIKFPSKISDESLIKISLKLYK